MVDNQPDGFWCQEYAHPLPTYYHTIFSLYIANNPTILFGGCLGTLAISFPSPYVV